MQLFEKLQSNIGNLWSCFKKIWPFNRKNAVKLSPEMEAFQETHKLAMDFATNIVGLTDFVIRVATAQCGYYTDIVYEILKKEEEALELDIKKNQHRQQTHKKRGSCYDIQNSCYDMQKSYYDMLDYMRDYYWMKRKYQDFKSIYGKFRESLKVLLSIKQSINITQNLYDGKNLAEELQNLSFAFEDFYFKEAEIMQIAEILDMEAEDMPFCNMLSHNEIENYRKQIWDAKMQWVYVDFLPSSEYDARLNRLYRIYSYSKQFSDPAIIRIFDEVCMIYRLFRERINLVFYAPIRGYSNPSSATP